MDRITRSKLKTDRFAVEVEHSVEYVAGHRKQVAIYGGIGLAVVLVAAGAWYYRDSQRAIRQAEIAKAMNIVQAPVTVVAPPAGALYFPELSQKNAAADKAFKELMSKYPGTSEATVAATYLGSLSMDQNKLPDAEKYFKQVVESGDENQASIGKLSLAQVYMSTNRPADAEKILRELLDRPTLFVSKEQAAIALARALMSTKPAEARKLLDPLKTERPAVSQVAIALLGELPPQ